MSDFKKDLVSFPTPFLRALENDKYTKGHSDFSVTQLLGPPQATYLATKSERVESGYSSFMALLGTAIHSVLESNVDESLGEMAEVRFYHTMLGVVVSGQADFIENGTLFDYKNTGGVQDQAKPDHRDQAQMNGYLAVKNGVTINQVAVVYLQRDWSYLQSTLNPTYPQSPFRIFIFDYDEAYAEKLFFTKIPEHLEARNGNPRPCTKEEKWEKPETYALIKPEGKRASKVCSTMAEAEENKKPGQIIQVRKGEATKCLYFCGYSQHCIQHQNDLAQSTKFEE